MVFIGKIYYTLVFFTKPYFLALAATVLWLSRSVSCVSRAAPNAPELFDDTGDWDDE